MNVSFFSAGVMWVAMLGLLTIAGYLHPLGTFGRWVAPYTLSAMVGIILVYLTAQTMMLLLSLDPNGS